LPTDEDVDDGAFGAVAARGFFHVLLGAGPAVANPHRNRSAVDDGRGLVAMNLEMTQLLGRALGEALRADDAIRLGVEKLVLQELETGRIVAEPRLPIAEL